MEQRDAIGPEQRFHCIKELFVVREADMLEHPDRNDAIELPGEAAIVDQLEPHLAGDALPFGFGAGLFQLFLRKRDA